MPFLLNNYVASHVRDVTVLRNTLVVVGLVGLVVLHVCVF